MLIQQFEKNKPVNLFLGAGISKLAPSYAPIWREMQIGFCEALFARMKSEGWDVDDIEGEIEQLRRFNFRPETFWERVLGQTDMGFVSAVLSIVNIGLPNLNHNVIGELCSQEVVNNIVTTNFDEYLDKVLPPNFQIIINQQQDIPAGSRKLYFKIHGTSSASDSLQFTLKHTKQLPGWKADLLKSCLQGRPLIIVGYSGWDDDIMPFLLTLAPNIPEIIVVRHPGANPDEPVTGLAKLPQTRLVEADFSKETQLWKGLRSNTLTRFARRFATISVPKEPDSKAFYRQAIEKLDVPKVPFLVSLLFELAANRALANKYAWLADDACNDKRYQSQVSDDFRRQVKVYLSHVVAAHDSEFSQLLMSQAHENYPQPAAAVATTTMEGVDRVFEYFYAGQLTPAQENEIEYKAMGALNLHQVGVIQGQGIQFRAGWCMGRLRMRQSKLAESVQFYIHAMQDLPEGLDDVQKGSFLLDFGLAAFRYSAMEKNNEMLSTAIMVLLEAERIAANINDHMTTAKAMMNLSNCYVMCGEFDLSMEKVKSAQALAHLTGDYGLQMRAMSLESQIVELIDQLRK